MPPSVTLTYALPVTVTLTPASTSLIAGTSQSYTATATATDGTTFDVTSTSTFTVTGGTCTANTCTPTATGTQTVTVVSDATVTPASITVTAAAPTAVDTVTASPNPIEVGQSTTLTATGKDAYGNNTGPLTGVTYATTTPGATCTGNVCTATQPGTLTITSAYNGTAGPTTTVTVNPPPNSAPVAGADNYTATAGTTLTVAAPGVLGNDSDPDAGDTLTAAVVTGPSHGAVNLAADGSFSYTPTAGYTGSDAFTYQAVDKAGARSAITTVSITVNAPPNQAPTANPDSYTTTAGAPSLSVPAPGVLGNDTDPDTGDTLTAAPVTGPSNGTLNLAADGSFTYTPRNGFTGTDTFTYQAVDKAGARSSAATATITVNRANADLAITVTAPSTAARGGSFPVTVTVVNSGPSTATLVATGLTVSRGLTVTNGGGGAVSRDKQSVGFLAGTLRPGATVTYTVTVTADRSTGTRTISAGTVSNVRDNTLGNNVSQRSVRVS